MKAFIGEFLGTMTLVLIGCGTVAVAVLFEILNLYGVALLFGGGVTLAIYVSKNLSPAHLNPAVSFAFLVHRDLNFKIFSGFVIAQLLGAILGGGILLLVFNSSIVEFEMANSIVRGSAESYHSAMMFGEFYPNPGFEKELEVSHISAIFFEALGTFILMMMIFNVQRIQEITRIGSPIIIGLTVSILIVFIAPYTQGGFNPARDFGPRVIAYLGGWGDAALPNAPYSFFTVYILGPLTGASLATVARSRLQRN